MMAGTRRRGCLYLTMLGAQVCHGYFVFAEQRFEIGLCLHSIFQFNVTR